MSARYFIKKTGPDERPYCVYSAASGKNLGCSRSHVRAQAMIAALSARDKGEKGLSLDEYEKQIKEGLLQMDCSEPEGVPSSAVSVTPQAQAEEKRLVEIVDPSDSAQRHGEAAASEHDDSTPKIQGIYDDRNKAALLAAALATKLGFPAGLQDSDDPAWPLLYVELPKVGQASWHLPAELAKACSKLPKYAGKWDGHTQEEKNARIMKFISEDVEEENTPSAEVEEEQPVGQEGGQEEPEEKEAAAAIQAAFDSTLSNPHEPQEAAPVSTLMERTRDWIASLFEAHKEKWTTAYINDLPDASFFYIEPGGKKDDEGKTIPRSLRHLPYKDANGKVDVEHVRNAIARAPQTQDSSGKPLAEDIVSRIQAQGRKLLGQKKMLSKGPTFWTTKQADGNYRWFSISSTAFLDRDNEIVSELGLSRAVERTQGKGGGPLRFWHIKGLDVGDCDFQALDGLCLLESGLWRSDPVSTAMRKGMERYADEFGVSIGFYPKEVKLGMVVRGHAVNTVFDDIETVERSLLPREWSSNPFTMIGTEGSVDMAIRQEQKDVLLKLLGDGALVDSFLERAKAVNEMAEDTAAIFKSVADPLAAVAQEIQEAHPEAAAKLIEAKGLLAQEEDHSQDALEAVQIAKELLPDDLSTRVMELFKSAMQEDLPTQPAPAGAHPEAQVAGPEVDPATSTKSKELSSALDRVAALEQRLKEIQEGMAPRATLTPPPERVNKGVTPETPAIPAAIDQMAQTIVKTVAGG